jgi:diguanylate cyclase (GGDEF)-like protein
MAFPRPPAASQHGYFSPEKVTRRYLLALALLAACVLANFAIMQASLAFQQRQVSISALSAQQSRLFSDIGLCTRSLMQAATQQDTPEQSLAALRERIKDSGRQLRDNMEEILRLDDEPVAGVFRLQVMTRFYREKPHNLEEKIDRYIERTNEIASLSTEHLGIRINQWIPMDIAVSTGTHIQNSFDAAMEEAHNISRLSVAAMEFAERALTLFTLGLLVFEGMLLFAPLVRALREESTRIKSYERELEAKARTDQLTGLANRVLFYERLAAVTQQAHDESARVALILFDLDKFKPINDTLGHQAGDALLKEVAVRVARVVGPEPLVARLGGDEFAVVMNVDFALEGLEPLLARIAEAIEEPLFYRQWEMKPAASLGAALFPSHGDEPERLFAAADAALCAAKKEHAAYCVYDERMRAQDDEARALALDLKRAAPNGELCIYYQPQFTMHGGRCVGFEALLRWNHPQKGLLSAGRFVHMAERLGLVPEITAQVVETVARDIRAWLDQGLDPGVVGVNMPEEMFATDLAEQMLDRTLSRYNVPYGRICVEVTEDVFLNRASEQIAERLATMRALGMRISFDDFGTGYASLSHLKHFPFDELKIDRSFVNDLTHDVRSVEIIRALVGLARNLGKTVIAEGIETEEQRALLLAEGCPVGQGFLFSEAEPFEHATRRLISQNAPLSAQRGGALALVEPTAKIVGRP